MTQRMHRVRRHGTCRGSEWFTRAGVTGFAVAVVPLIVSGVLSGCLRADRRVVVPRDGWRDRVSLIAPRCAHARSCLLGRVTAAETGLAVSEAVVFIQRAKRGPLIVRVTDHQGVFTYADPVLGAYRIAVYRGSRRVEVEAVGLGRSGAPP
ncbi:MAG: hypothetical protein V3V08_07810 [Nannocystaceae bacterium]